MKNTYQQTNHKNSLILNERKNITYILRKKYPNMPIEDIEDVVQTTLFKALKFYDSTRETNIKTFLLTIANNHIIDIHRRSYKKLECSESDIADYETIFMENDFSETFCNQDFQKNIIKKLFSGYENNIIIETFILSVIKEKDYEEIAIIHNTNNANVRKRIERARKLLQKKYQEIVAEQ